MDEQTKEKRVGDREPRLSLVAPTPQEGRWLEVRSCVELLDDLLPLLLPLLVEWEGPDSVCVPDSVPGETVSCPSFARGS